MIKDYLRRLARTLLGERLWAGRRHLLHYKLRPIDIAVHSIVKSNNFTIVQIGAFVGKSETDPLFFALQNRLRRPSPTKSGLPKVILVEPVKQYFDLLKQNYLGIDGIAFENVAISNIRGPAIFHRLGVDPVDYGYPAWLAELGSLREERMHSLWDAYERNSEYKSFVLKHLIQEEVACITFNDLLARHDIRSIDILQIDVEGFEYEILKSIDFSSIPVRFVNYESILLQEHASQCESMMQAHGYSTIASDQDTFCFKARDTALLQRFLPKRR